MYEFLGKLFISLIIFVVVWFATVYVATKTTKGWEVDGKEHTAFFFSGPVYGLIVAVLVWLYVLPTVH